MDENGNLFLEGQPINKKLYKHSASIGLYGGDVSDEEKAVIKKINITPRPLGNYITGLYAPAGEVIKIEISEEDLTKTGGFNVFIGNAGNRSSLTMTVTTCPHKRITSQYKHMKHWIGFREYLVMMRKVK